MKKSSLIVLTSLFLACLCAFTLVETQAIRSLEKIGIPASAARDCIWSSLSGGYLSYPNPTKLKQIASGDRAAAIREIVEFAKSYVRTEEFKKQYLEYRQNQKPTPPDPPKSMAQQRKEQKEQMQKNITETEKNIQSMPAESQQIMKQTIDMMKQQIKEIDNPENPMFSPQMEEYAKQSYDAQVAEYNTKLAEWEQQYPENPAPMIRNWLTNFLDVTKDIDFNAKLKKGQNGKMVFVNGDYEAKSGNWKMCYRAGKEAVQAGRAAAQQWLGDLR